MAKKVVTKRKKKEIPNDTHMVNIAVEETMTESFGNYAKYVNMERSIPDVRDGLLPVQRRLLYAMHTMGWTSNKAHVKSARPVAETMGKYHPHGDCKMGSTQVRLLDGSIKTMEELYNIGEDQEVLAIDNEGKIVPAVAHSFRIGQYTDKIYHIHLLNGFEILTTGNHPFRTLDGHWVKAEDLTPMTALDYANITEKYGNYSAISGHKTNVTAIHKLVAEHYGLDTNDSNLVLHHKNEDKKDNRKVNLEVLTRAEHALHHKDYLTGLEIGRREMFEEEGKFFEEVRKKNTNLMRFNNEHYSIIRANNAINILRERNLDLTFDNYETLRSELYNLPYVDRMIQKGSVESFNDLLEMNIHEKGIQTAIKEKFELIDFNNNEVVTKSLEENRNPYKLEHSVKSKHKQLRPSFIRAMNKLGRLPRREEVVNTSGVNNSLNVFNSDAEMYNIMGDIIPIVTDVYVEEVNQVPMYDFTVDTHENMLIVASDDKSLLLCSHNSSIYGAMARMSKDWIMNETAIDMDGNNGNIDGDREAAYRYTESRLSPYAEDILLSSLSMKGIVPMRNNFDDTLQEPEYLPSKLPNILINGSEGIGVAYASNIPTFNVEEVLKGCIAQIKKPNISNEEMFKIIPTPDFPTGGVISGYRGYYDLMTEGRGTIKVRGKFHIEEDDKTYTIVFTEIPYGSLKPNITKVIEDDIYNKNISGIVEARDESGRDGLRYAVICKKDADRNAILGYLFTKTELQKNVPMNMVVIANGKPRQLGVNDVIKYFNDFRMETFIKGLNIQIADLEHKKHIAEGHILLVDNIERVVEIIKHSENKAESRERLMEAIGFTEKQVEVILNMSLHRISKTDSEKYVSIVEDCAKEIAARQFILSSDANIRKQLIKNYQGLIKRYGKTRRTELIEEVEDWTFSKVDIIPDEKVVVGITKQGFIKRSSTRSYKTTENGVEDLVAAFETTTRKHVILLTSNGEYAFIPVFQIPESRWGDAGKHINTLGSELGANDVVFACEYDDENPNQHILAVKSDGLVKLSKASDYVRNRGFFTLTVGVKMKGDEKVQAAFSVDLDEENFIAFEDSKGHSMYFPVKEVSVTGIRTAGSIGMRLNKKQNRTIEMVDVFQTVEEIPNHIEYRERGQAGWQRKKETTSEKEEVAND